MSIFKGRLSSSNKFTAQDDVLGLELLKGRDSSGNALPAYIQLESADGQDNYIWVDDSENVRMNTSAPTNSTKNAGGTIITAASSAGANRTLSNLGTVAVATDFLPNGTYDLGNSSNYWAEGYITKLYGSSTATLTGSANTWTFACNTVTLGADGTDTDLILYGETAGQYIQWDGNYSTNAGGLLVKDNVIVDIGTGHDLSIASDGDDVNFDTATDDTIVIFGASNDLDVQFKDHTNDYDAGWISDIYTFQVTDNAVFQIGGSAFDTVTTGFQFVFDGTATLNIDAVTAQDSITIGENTATDFELHGTNYDILWDASADELKFGDNVEVIFGAGSDLQIEATGTHTYFTLGATTSSMIIQPYDAGTVAALAVDGASASHDWNGANDVGMVHISSDTDLAHAGATLLMVASSNIINDAEGGLARFLDTAAAGGGTAEYAVEIYSANNEAMNVSKGLVKLTNGDLIMAEGKVTVATTTNETSYIKRNKSGSDCAILELEDTDTTGTGIALLLDQNATGNSTALQIAHDGDYPAIDIDAGAARTGNVIDIAMANQLAQTAIDITGAATGTNGEGIVHVDVTGVLAGDAIRVDSTGANAATAALFKGISTGKQAGATNGIVASFTDTGAATATSYTVYIASTSNEALYVDTGKVVVDEYVTAGVASATAGGLVTACSSTDLHNTTPTNAQFDTAFGSTALAQAGFIGVAMDSSDTTPYIVVSDGTDWFYTPKLTKAA